MKIFLLHEDFRSRSWAEKVEEAVLLSPRSDTRVCLIRQDDSDLPPSGIFQAGCRRRRGGKVRTAHMTQLYFQVPKRRFAGINATTPLFSSTVLIKTPKFCRAHYGHCWVGGKQVRRSAFRDAPTTFPETSTSPGSHICQAAPNSSFPGFPSPSSVPVPPNGVQRQQQFGWGAAGPRGANAAPGPHSPRRAQVTASALRPPAGGRAGQRPAR